MKIGFIDLGHIRFTPLTPDTAPLGGMQSGVAYLSRELAARGHEVTLVSRTDAPGPRAGVTCLSLEDGLNATVLGQFDAVISIFCDGETLRALGVTCPLFLWTGHSFDEPTVQKLAQPTERRAWSAIAMKSRWQLARYARQFAIPAEQLAVMANALSPLYLAQPPRDRFFFETGAPPTLIYSSTPGRGLDLLLDAFPLVRTAVPDARLWLYSSHATYQLGAAGALETDLLDKANRTDGVTSFGSVSKPDLAAAFAGADILAYPSTFEETACNTLIEAMVSGVMISANDLGALKETGNGFGHYATYPPGTSRAECIRLYAGATIDLIAAARAAPVATRATLTEQMAYARTLTWAHQAEAWEALIASHRASSARARKTQPAAALPRNATTIKGRDGKPVYVNPEDERGRRLIAAGGSLNPVTLAVWHHLLGEPGWSHIVDIGANYGEMIANGRLPPRARVIAVEPGRQVLPYLRRTLAHRPAIALEEVALSDHEGFAMFAENLDWSGVSRLIGPAHATRMVRLTTLRALMGPDGADPARMRLLLKIDVEGHEPGVLDGLGDMLPALADFAALVEIEHLSEADLGRLGARFDFQGFHITTRQLVPLPRIDFRQMADRNIHRADIVLRRKA